MSLPTLHDTLRHIIRSMAFRSEDDQRRALLSVDAHERQFGTADTDAYQVELDKQNAAAARAANPDAPETADERANRLEAELARTQALLRAQTSGATPAVTPPPVA